MEEQRGERALLETIKGSLEVTESILRYLLDNDTSDSLELRQAYEDTRELLRKVSNTLQS